MDLSLDQEQEMLRGSARAFFEREWNIERTRALETDPWRHSSGLVWKRLAELGWLNPASDSTPAGAGVVELSLVAEEMGRALFPSPLIESVVVAGWLTAVLGTQEQKSTILAQIAAGDLVVTTAFFPRQRGFGRVDVASEAKGLRLSGSCELVRHANSARLMLWPIHSEQTTDCVTLAMVDLDAPGVTLRPLPNIAGESLFSVSVRNVLVPHARLLGGDVVLRRFLDEAQVRASVVQCSEMAGAAQRVQEMTLDYARSRQQFGQPIGKFQLVQSLCVDIAADTHRIGLLARQAAWLIDAGEEFVRPAAIAAAFAAEAIARIVRNAHEVHAGMGFMTDYDLQLFTRRTKHWETSWGGARYHLDRIANEMLGANS